jgi:hypothetical protein
MMQADYISELLLGNKDVIVVITSWSRSRTLPVYTVGNASRCKVPEGFEILNVKWAYTPKVRSDVIWFKQPF